MCGFEGICINLQKGLAWWLSWLERRPVTAEVVGSNPIRVVGLIFQKKVSHSISQKQVEIHFLVIQALQTSK